MEKGRSEWEVKIPKKPFKDKLYFGNLKAMVLDTNLCSRCLTCASVCPPGGIIVTAEDRVDLPNWEDKCTDCGACVRVCPRFDYKPQSGLGDYVEIIAAKSKRFKGQDGAMVAEIVASAIEMEMIDRGLFVGRDEQWVTNIFHVHEPEQLDNEAIRLSGTKYSFSKALQELKEAVRFTKKGVAAIGTPCMISGIKKLQKEFSIFREKIQLVLGLFCTENFHLEELTRFLREKGVVFEKLVKTDITKGKFIATMTDGKVKFGVKELDEIIPSGCRVCIDFTAVESDASVGSVGSEAGFSTAIVRAKNVKEVMDYIKERGYVHFGEVVIDDINRLSELKKKREKNIEPGTQVPT